MVVKIKNRHRLKRKEIRDLLLELHTRFSGVFFTEDSAVDIGLLEEFTVYLVNDEIVVVRHNGKAIFTLQGIMRFTPTNHYVVVDMGAIGFITKGADVMGPGIIDVDTSIHTGDYVWVYDEKYRKPLVIGIALMNGDDMKLKKPGKAVKTIHYVGDQLWALSHT